MYHAEREQLARRQKMLDILAKQSMAPQQTQIVGGRAVPQGIEGVLGPVFQAIMAKKGGEDIVTRGAELDAQQAEGVQSAMRDTMTQYTGKPAEVLPQGQYGPAAPAIPADPTGAAMNVATDPYLSQSKPAQAMMMQLMRGRGSRGSGSLPKPVAGSKGFMTPSRNADGTVSWQPMVDRQGQPVLPVAADAANRGDVSGEIEKNKLLEQIQRKAELEKKIQDTKQNAAMNNPNSPEYIKQQSLYSKDYNTNNIIESTYNDVKNDVDYILAKENESDFNSNFGGWNATVTQFSPGAQTMRKRIESLKSKMKSAGLAKMRANGSPGQVTEREWPIMEGITGSLDPVLNESDARESLTELLDRLKLVRDDSASVFSDKWQNTPFSKGNPVTKGKIAPKDNKVMKFDAQGNLIP